MLTKINEAHEFLTELSENSPRLPFDPDLLPQLFQGMADGSQLPLSSLAAMLERSQALAAKVLSVANSACYGLQGQITSLTRAAQVLGILELRSLVLFFSANEAIPSSSLPRGFPTGNLWEHQIRTALLGQAMARLINSANADNATKAANVTNATRAANAAKTAQTTQTGQANLDTPQGHPHQEQSAQAGHNLSGAAQAAVDPDSIYTAGLLHDIGKVVLAAKRPQAWQDISAISRDKPCDFATAEDEYWGIDHGALAAILLKNWDLPDLLTEMINWHHHPALSENYKLEVHILAAANKLAVLGLDGEGNIPAEVLDILPQYVNLLEQHKSELQQALTDEKATLLSAFAG